MFRKITAFALAGALTAGTALAAQTPQFMVPEHNYTKVYSYSEGYAVAMNDLKPGAYQPAYYRYALMDWEGKEVIAPGTMSIDSFYSGRSAVKIDNSIGFMDHSFQLTVPTIYSDNYENAVQYYRYYGGLALVDDGNEDLLIDKQGNVIHSGHHLVQNGISYEPLRYLTGRNTFNHANEPTIQNFSGTIKRYLDPETNEWTSFAERPFSRYQVPYTWSDEAMRLVPHLEESTYTADYRYYIPTPDGQSYFFDLSEDPEFVYCGGAVIDGMVTVADRRGKYGIAKLDGTLVLPCQYDELSGSADLSRLSTYNNVKFVARKDGRPVCIDIHGQEYFPFLERYDNLVQLFLEADYLRLGLSDGTHVDLDFEGNEVDIPKFKEEALTEKLGLEDGWEVYNLYEDRGTGLIRIWNPSKLLVSYLYPDGSVALEPMEFHPSVEAHQSLSDLVAPFSQGRAAFWRPDGKWVFLIHPDWVSQDAALSSCKVTVDGQGVDFNAYLMKGSNYFKLRDLAMALKGTQAEFSVEYEMDSGVTYLQTANAYVPVGGELAAGDGIPLKWATPTHAGLYVNGRDPDLLGFTIGENNYYKLRDIARLLNVNVTWDQESGTVAIETGAPYTD